MEYLSFDSPKKTLELRKGAVPEPGADEVLIRVAYAGICGTDLHILEGSFPCKQTDSLILGHEFAGTVESVGPAVKNFKPGQRVAVDPNSGCNACDDCHSGCYHFCQAGGSDKITGIFKNGGWSSHCVVPEDQVYHVPEGVDMQQAALSEPLSCLAHGWNRMNPIHVGQRVLVIGAGIIGLLWACLLHLHGLRKTVTVSEMQDKRKGMVSKLGVDYEVSSPGDLKGREFDVVVDCSGSAAAMESAIPLLARGGRFCVFGVANPQAKVSFSPYEMYKKELTFAGVNVNPFTFSKGLGLLSAMSSAYLQYDNLGIKIFKLVEYKEALNALKNGEISKAVFKL